METRTNQYYYPWLMMMVDLGGGDDNDLVGGKKWCIPCIVTNSSCQ